MYFYIVPSLDFFKSALMQLKQHVLGNICLNNFLATKYYMHVCVCVFAFHHKDYIDYR